MYMSKRRSWLALARALVGPTGSQCAPARLGGATCQPASGYSFDLGIEFQYPVLTWGRSEGDIFEW